MKNAWWFGIFISLSIPNGVSEFDMMGKRALVWDKNEAFFKHGQALGGGAALSNE
jgi:hypothetical protein